MKAQIKPFLKLREYAQAIGLAFQVQDDILDIISDTAVLGKTAGKDEQVDKSTYPALMGLEEAEAYAKELHDQAFNALKMFAENAAELTRRFSEACYWRVKVNFEFIISSSPRLKKGVIGILFFISFRL